MTNEQLPYQLADLFSEVGQAHHQAYFQTDGADPEWPLWYAEYLQEKIGRLLNRSFTVSELVYHLVRLDKAYLSKARRQSWQEFYGRELIEAFGD